MIDEGKDGISMRHAVVGAVVFVALGAASGYAIGIRDFPTVNSAVLSAEPPAGVDFSPVWKAWNIIDEKFVPASVATSTPIATSTEEANLDKVWGMVAGLAASLNDPYTYFLPPSDTKLFTDDMSGSFEGVGMEIAVRDQILTVVSPLKGSPAEKAGIKSGDKVLKIDGVDTKGIDISAAVKKIRGPGGSEVVLTILRDGWPAAKEIKVTRGVINVPAIETKTLSNGVFVISVMSFTANSSDLFRSSLRKFIQSGNSRLIIDMRGNPGGYLESAVDMASWFLPIGKVIVTEDYAGNAQNIVHRSRGYDIFTDKLKMVILVNRGSASASEILSEALRHYGKAKLVGEPTFGKGSVQELIDITADTSLKLTIARWLAPDGKQIPTTGIVPDVEVKMTEEDAKAEKDPQMDKAVEMLLGQ
ncbi:MAG: S41 family peptidase [bacterium]|nr:S41 family peptidase [bacterium]